MEMSAAKPKQQKFQQKKLNSDHNTWSLTCRIWAPRILEPPSPSGFRFRVVKEKAQQELGAVKKTKPDLDIDLQ
ncbi:hypothetical protein lerEdw1_005224 [Lerista edwardsae]|nr:hypothetical protein lerEdw1_005224 [Lerista edwardsae]